MLSLKGHVNPKLFYYDSFSSPSCVRSVSCLKVTRLSTKICTECSALRRNPKFLVTLKSKKKKRNQLFTNDKYCSHQMLCSRLKKYRGSIYKLRLDNHILSKKVVSLRKVKTTLSDVMAEATCRSDQKSIYYNLKRAYNKGYLNDKKHILSFMTDISANIRRRSNGKRYTAAMKDFYAWIRIKGGPRMIRFLQDNLDGPGTFYAKSNGVSVL